MDTPLDKISMLKPVRISGLYFEYKGEKYIPKRVWFGCGLSWIGTPNGLAYCHFDNALRPVCTQDGKHFRISYLANVTASYDNIELSDWRRE